MNAATLLTPNAVARRQVYVDWAEGAERTRRQRAFRRKSLVVGVPLALLAGAAALTLSGAPQRLIAQTEVSLGAPAPTAPAPPSAMIAQPVRTLAAPRMTTATVAAPTAHVAVAARRPSRATGRSGPATINEHRPARATLVQGRQGDDGHAETTSEGRASERDRLAALDAIRDLRLR